ncbi:MAG: PEP-CTERM sorting domain-containing protein [Pirellulaceae bacterium]|nr:PEP-CTERM sorting domain-containing protein [Pirellulaceae bacterium]
MLTGLRTIFFGFGLMLLLSVSSSLRADLFLAVDFDIATPGIQSNAILDSNGKTSAWLVLFLTGNTDLYAYQFSVRYNADRLTLDSKDDTPPANVNGKTFAEALTNERSSTGSDGNFANYVEINRFDGKIVDPSNTLVITGADTVNGLVLGVLNFRVRGGGDDLLVMPGVYEPFDPGDDVKPFDVFLGNDGAIPVTIASFGGGSIVAVPEPSSLLLVAAVGLAWIVRRRIR